MHTNFVNKSEDVKLSFCHHEHHNALESFWLPEEQLQFTGMPNELLKLSKEDKHRHPVVILAESTPVGFFILYDGEEITSYTDKTQSLLLRGFSINHVHQGNGYGKKALLQLREFVKHHFDVIDEVVLAVNVKNIPAKSLYIKCGFKDIGDTRMGSIGLQHVLYFPIREGA